MKILKSLTAICLAFTIFIPNFIVCAQPINTQIFQNYNELKIENHTEELYKKISDFLNEYKDIPPEKFDDICIKYMKKDLKPLKIINNKEFQEKSKENIILYRGINQKRFANDFKNGIVYFPPNDRNVNGTGIYTTTSLDCAKDYSGGDLSGAVVKMLIPRTGIKILENQYLEKLKDIIRRNHKDEFGDFTSENKQNYIFDSMQEYIDEQSKKIIEKYEKIENQDEYKRLVDEALGKIKKDPNFQILKDSRKRYFKNNKAAIFYNSGLLAKLLGFDILYSIDYLRNFVGYKEEEYLIVNPEILSILND